MMQGCMDLRIQVPTGGLAGHWDKVLSYVSGWDHLAIVQAYRWTCLGTSFVPSVGMGWDGSASFIPLENQDNPSHGI